MESKRRIPLSQRLRYAFDQSMAAGPIALIGWLTVISLVLILAGGTFLVLTGIHPPADDGGPGDALSFGEATWQSLMRAMDAGGVGGDHGVAFRATMFVVTIGGIFIISSLIGVLTSGLESKMDELRKGRSFVIESDHTLILGWSSAVFTIVSELVIANANQKKPRIVILADKDKVEMEEEIRSKVGSTGRTRVICRTGSPIDLYDLDIANPHQAKSIIILSPEGDNPDSQVTKSILALTNNPRRRPEPYHIVAEIRDPKNMEVAHMVGKGEAQLVQANDLIARITVQTCRQSGMSVVYTELLDYDGDEIYFQEEPALVGRTYGDAILGYDSVALLGLQFADGRVQLNPASDTQISTGDKVIAIAEDDDKIVLSAVGSIDESAIRAAAPAAAKPERTLILGWNRRGPIIIHELDSYVAPGSEVTVVAELAEADYDFARHNSAPQNLNVTFQEGDTTDRATLEGLEVSSYTHIIVLAYAETLELQEADARTLITLLHLRNLEEKSETPFSIVSEMLDVRNRELAEVTQADDFIVSDRLISLLLAQVSENKHLHAVFADLFDSEGSEIYLKPVSDYVNTGQAVNYYTVAEAARRRGESAIGYRISALKGDSSKQYGVAVNPRKSASLTFAPDDRIIVLASD